MRARVASCCLVAVLAVPALSSAQQVGVGTMTQRYTFGARASAGLSRVDLFWAPFAVQIPLGGAASWSASGGLIRGSLAGVEGKPAELQGMATSRIGVDIRLAGGGIALGALALLPGSDALESLAGARLLGIVATDLLPFDVEPWGGGLGLGGTVGSTLDVAGLELEIEGGYVWRGPRAFEGGGLVYRPGAGAHARVSGSLDVGGASTLSMLVGFQRFTPDIVADESVFRSGARLESLVTLAFPIGFAGAAQVYGGFRHRGKGSSDLAHDWLPGIAEAPSRRLVLAGFDLRFSRPGVAVLPEGELRVLRSADAACFLSASEITLYDQVCPGGQGWLFTTGLTLQIHLGDAQGHPRVTVAPFGRVRVGEVEDWKGGLAFTEEGPRTTPANGSSVRGWQFGVAVIAGR